MSHNCDNETCVQIFSYSKHKAYIHTSEVNYIRYEDHSSKAKMIIFFMEKMCEKTSLPRQSNLVIKGIRAKHAYENLKNIEGIRWI